MSIDTIRQALEQAMAAAHAVQLDALSVPGILEGVEGPMVVVVPIYEWDQLVEAIEPLE